MKKTQRLSDTLGCVIGGAIGGAVIIGYIAFILWLFENHFWLSMGVVVVVLTLKLFIGLTGLLVELLMGGRR